MRYVWLALSTFLLTSYAHYPPPLNPAEGQTAAQLEADAKDSAASQLVSVMFTAWSEKDRDKYVTCMQGKGYAPAPK